MTSWARSALAAALASTGIASCIAISAGLVRLLPWLLDPSVTWHVATPFAQSLTVVALEAALAVGWPVGWGLATQAFVQRGEARVLALLGERPARTVARLGAQGVVLGGVLAFLSFASARESTEPGRVVSELIAHGRSACAEAEAPRTYTVPFFGATWLCGGGGAASVPRLVGQGPGRLAALTFSARDAHVSGDLGSIDLEDAHIAVLSPPASLHVDALRIRGAAPWGQAATVPPVARAVALSAAVILCGLVTVALLLLARDPTRLLALVIGASGPIAALALLRSAERLIVRDASMTGMIALIPLLAPVAPLVLAIAGARLPGVWHAASKYRL